MVDFDQQKRSYWSWDVVFRPIRVWILVDETRRSPIEKLLPWCVLTGVWVSWRRPDWCKDVDDVEMLQYCPTCPALLSVIWSRSWAASSCSWLWWRDTSGATSSSPGFLSSRRSGGCAEPPRTPGQSEYEYSIREVFVVWRQESCVLSYTHSVICHPGMG